MAISTYEPLAEVRGLLDELMRDAFVRPVRPVLPGEPAGERPAARMRVDVTEGDEAFQIHADIPGVSKEDIQVTLEGDVLSISAERAPRPATPAGIRVLCNERRTGRIGRAFRLGTEVDMDRAQARYENGVLELTLPKRHAEPVRRLAVN
jgi:HSP20 family protein